MAIVSKIEATCDTYVKQGYQILNVPIEFYDRFDMDMQAALMNIAGVSISHTTRFISYKNLSRCYNECKNPFTSAVISLGLYDNLAIKDFFQPELIQPEIYSRPIFIHIDTSLTGDRTGISADAAMGLKTISTYSIERGDVINTKSLAHRHVFTVGIQAPTNSEISFQKTRDFIYYLKYDLGWNIRGISLDGFQSADTRQGLITMGFEDTKIISLDKSPDPYLTYRTAINEQRISHLHIEELEFEVINLARDNVSGKIDHDIDKSKDMSDSYAGAVYNAEQHVTDLDFAKADMFDIIDNVNTEGDQREIASGNLLNSMVANKTTIEDIIEKQQEHNNLIDDGFFFL